MNQALLASVNSNKMQSYQLIYIEKSVIDTLKQKFTSNNINLTILNNLKSLYLIDAPSKLGMILSRFTNYNLFTFKNIELPKLILFFRKQGFEIHSFEFVGEKYFEEELSQTIESILRNPSADKILDVIKKNSLEISKFKMKKQSTNVIIYRSGLIHTNENREELTKIMSTFFEDL